VVQGAKSASEGDVLTNKRVCCAVGNGLLLAVGLGGGLAGGALFGLCGLGLRFGLRAGFAVGVVGRFAITDDALATLLVVQGVRDTYTPL